MAEFHDKKDPRKHDKYKKKRFGKNYAEIKREVGLPCHIPHKFVIGDQGRKDLIELADPFPGIPRVEVKKFISSDEHSDTDARWTIHKLPQKKKKTKKETGGQPKITGIYEADELVKLIEEPENQTKFLFLAYSHPRTCFLFSFYRFKVITAEEVNNDDYRAITDQGFVEFRKDQIYFTPMEEFKYQIHLHAKLKEIPITQYFHMYKVFMTWHKMIQWRRMRRNAIRLNHFFIYQHHYIREALMKISTACWHLSHYSFYNDEHNDKITLYKFMGNQMLQVTMVQNTLEDLRAMSLQLVLNICIAHLLEKGFTTDDKNLEISDELKDAVSIRALKTSFDGKYIMPIESQLEKLKECEILIRFITLADYMIQNLLRTIVHNTYEKFIKRLIAQFKHLPDFRTKETLDFSEIETLREKSPLDAMFVTIIIINKQQNLDISPNRSKWRNAFFALMEKWETVCEGIKPILGDPIMDSFTNPTIGGNKFVRLCGKGPDLHHVFKKDDFIKECRREINKKITINIGEIYQYITKFKFLCDSHRINIRMDPRKIKHEIDLKNIRLLMDNFEKQSNILNNLLDGINYGIFFVVFTTLKYDMAPLCNRLYEVVKETLPEILGTRVAQLINEIEEAKSYLAVEPLTSLHFVEYMTFIDRMINRIEAFKDWYSYLNEIIDLSEEFNCPVPESDEDKFFILGNKIRGLHAIINQLADGRDDLIDRFNRQVEKDFFDITCRLEQISVEINEPWLTDKTSDREVAQRLLKDLMDKVQKEIDEVNELKKYQKRLQVEITSFELIDKVAQDVRLRELLWSSIVEFTAARHYWSVLAFDLIDPEDMQAVIAKFFKNISQFEKYLPPSDLVAEFKAEAEKSRANIPVIAALKNPCFKQRHWQKIEQILNCKITPDHKLTLAYFESLNIYDPDIAAALLELAAQASSESALEVLLKKVEDVWKVYELQIIPLKDSKDVFILAGTEELQAVVDESNINLGTISSSRYIGPIKLRVDEWVKNLELFSKTLDEWLTCQTNWLYLQPIFAAPDIQRQLPVESRLFSAIDKSWKDMMKRAVKNPLALNFGTSPGLYETLINNNKMLEQVLKCLEAYLESKRVIFPRFYFLSNDELLEILAQTRNPHAVQPHLTKCFDAISRLNFYVKTVVVEPVENDEDLLGTVGTPATTEVMTTDIEAMVSPEGETVDLPAGLKARGNVEEWLGNVEKAMFKSVWTHLKDGIVDLTVKPRQQWVLLHPSQVVLCAAQIVWAAGIHHILGGNLDPSISKTVDELLRDFEAVIIEELNGYAELVRGTLTKIQRKVLCALITLSVHSRDIVTEMIEAGVNTETNFDWVKRLRYYWESDIGDCTAKMATARHVYGYEYLGASDRLVVTPLTDKCYLCLMGALQLDLGGAPAGPAGTGKTETTKDLAKALAIQCVVFNCSDGLDYKMMGRFFSGLAQSGAWCCFDEFNRIDIEVLSVIAQQLITIRNAKASKASRFMFEGREIKLVRQCATFITMNPGYAGRTELPDNLKSVFRPMAMMVPDYGLIAEVILYSEGFTSSKTLAQKMVNMYKLCSEQLSQQDHYDFGMRAVKSVLVMAGSLKRAHPDIKEDIVLIRALRDSNLPKFLKDDAFLFQGIIGDLFPNVTIPEHDYGKFQAAIEYAILQKGLQPEKVTFLKAIQLYETMEVRWGVMNVGPTGSGKTVSLNVLKDTLTKLHADKVVHPQYRPVTIYTLNPKSVTMGELYGEVNLMTMEWKDGLLGIFVRTAVNVKEEIHQWVVCDGPVDAVWIENMNTVLDDNKMLCLANSERIKLTPWVHMVFEVQDLAQASPATVSRCGMVYYDPEELKWFPYTKTWADSLLTKNIITEKAYKFILELFQTYVENGFLYIKKKLRCGIAQVEIGKIAMFCTIFQYLLQNEEASKYALNLDWDQYQSAIYQMFAFSYIWAIGGNLIDADKVRFEIFVQRQFENCPEAKLPGKLSLWEVLFDSYQRKLVSWSTIMPSFTYNPATPFFDLQVPTTDTVRFGYLMSLLLDENHPVMITGVTGVGKSVVAKTVLDELLKTEKWAVGNLTFSAQTSSMRTQDMIEAKLEKKRKKLLGAPYGKRVVIFIDDVNMPKLEIYGAQPPVELLRQYLDFKGFFGRDKLIWKRIEDMVLSCACAPPGGGRNPLTPRYVRHFALLEIPSPTDETLKVIFSAIVKGFLLDFVGPVRVYGESMVFAAIDVYMTVARDFLPTPDKSHYVFNLRDLSKCIQGLLQANPAVMTDTRKMFRLFYHECLRVFHDRLINVEDKSHFIRKLCEICHKHLGTTIVNVTETSGPIKDPPLLIFGDFLQNAPKEDRIYEEIVDLEKLKNVLSDVMVDFNLIRGKEMKLIFFIDAIEHVCRLARIFRAERGNALLIGVGGMGKQSLTRLGAHINVCNCFQIELTKQYDYNSFHEDLRKVFMAAGVKKEDTVFLFTDTQIVQEEFLEDINNILNSGEVPNLFEADEREKAINGVREAAKAAKIDTTRDAIFEFFITLVRRRLHLSICMSPVGEAFRRRCRMFPSLVNCCTIDWYLNWPEDALVSVAFTTLTPIVEPHLVPNMSNICFRIHKDVEDATQRFYNEMRRRYYVTPSSYLDLLKLYETLLTKQKVSITANLDKISNGVKKINETNELVAVMQKQLHEMEPLLKEKSASTEKLMESLVVEKASADEVRQVVLADEAVAKEKAGECKALADDAQKDLDEALPAMEQAIKALDALNKNDINEVRVFIKPPNLVKFVMEAVCLLLGAKQDWASAKLVLGEGNFLKRLRDYDKDHIPEKLQRQLKAYIDHPDFQPDKVATQSKACKSLCMWVRAIDKYAKVYKVVEPKRRKVQEAEKVLNEMMDVLRAKQKRLAEVEGQIAKLEATYDKSLREKADLEATIQLCENRLDRAGRLQYALASEQVRWVELIKSLSQDIINLTGNVLVAAAGVAYLGPFTSNYRNELTNKWFKLVKTKKIPSSPTFSLIDILSDAYEVRTWITAGLPKDKVSVENGVYVTKTTRWPLMIDPQEQANRWIRQMEKNNNLKMVKLTDAGYMRVIEGAVRLGQPVLIWEVKETLDPSLRTILQKQTTVKSGRQLIRIGDSDVEYDPKFRLYITTKLSNPHYLPEICIQITLVNFTVTPSGLEDQLLSDVVSLERPDLEEIRSKLIVQINSDKLQLKAIEDKILKLLFSSEGNILDDEELVKTLNNSKVTAAAIVTRLSEAEKTEADITVAREDYRKIAARGSCIYFVIALLPDIDPMYQFSLKYFSMIFNTVIQTTPAVDDLKLRSKELINNITLAIYNNVSRGLFARHKLVFSFLLCTSILKQKKKIDETEYNFVINGPVGIPEGVPKKPDISTLSDLSWVSVYYLIKIKPKFASLPKFIDRIIYLKIGDFELTINYGGGKNVAKHPTDFNKILTDFEKMMLVKALREEKLFFAITEYVKLYIGEDFVRSPIVSLPILYEDISNIIPLIFVLSSGSDPVQAFLKFARDIGKDHLVQAISLGQGQGPIAQQMIKNGVQKGEWIFLQNCHLASSWMLTMEKIIMDISESPKTTHPDFRLYLSSMPSASFPVSVLQNSVKVTNEPPKGIRSNMSRGFMDVDTVLFNEHPFHAKWRRMVYALCFFHSIILERKKFGPLGFNILYEFSDSDRDCALLNLDLFCPPEKTRVPWKALQYIIGEITYGGRVTDYWDQRTVRTILARYFSAFSTSEYSHIGKPRSIAAYNCPESKTCCTASGYLKYIDQLPLIDNPDIFGMHENANIAFQMNETSSIISTVQSVQPKESGGAEGASSDEIVQQLSETIQHKIIKNIDIDATLQKHFEKDKKGRLPSLSTVLIQEISRFNKLLARLHSSIVELLKAIKGLVVMSEELEDLYKAFMTNTIPKMWSAVSYPSVKSLGSWIRDLEIRLDFITNWQTRGTPKSFWLSGFFFPQGFMTGVLQTHARKYDLAIDTLKIDFEVNAVVLIQEEIESHRKKARSEHPAMKELEEPKDGVLVHGLFLDAARFDLDTMLLADQYPGEINPHMPVLTLVPMNRAPEKEGRYEAPLYKTAARAGVLSTTGHSTNFVIAVLLPTKEDQSYWILRGTALLTQVTD